jgi:hypothetical protein
MRKVLKWIGIGLGVLVGLALVAVGVIYVWTESKLHGRGLDCARPTPGHVRFRVQPMP